jgi:hypothetical protein
MEHFHESIRENNQPNDKSFASLRVCFYDLIEEVWLKVSVTFVNCYLSNFSLRRYAQFAFYVADFFNDEPLLH